MEASKLAIEPAQDRGSVEMRVDDDNSFTVKLKVRAPFAVDSIELTLGAYDFIAMAGAAISTLGQLLARASRTAIVGRPH